MARRRSSAGLLLLRQVLQGDVERVVEGGGARRLGAADRALERVVVGREVLEDRRAVVELDDLGVVLRAAGS